MEKNKWTTCFCVWCMKPIRNGMQMSKLFQKYSLEEKTNTTKSSGGMQGHTQVQILITQRAEILIKLLHLLCSSKRMRPHPPEASTQQSDFCFSQECCCVFWDHLGSSLSSRKACSQTERWGGLGWVWESTRLPRSAYSQTSSNRINAARGSQDWNDLLHLSTARASSPVNVNTFPGV